MHGPKNSPDSPEVEGTQTPRPLRILLLTRELPGVTAYTGGVGPFFHALAEGLARRGHHVRVLVMTDEPVADGSTPYEIVRTPPPPRRLPHFTRSIEIAMAFRRASRSLDRVDIIFAPEWGGWGALLPRRDQRRLITNLVTSISIIREVDPAPSFRVRTWMADAIQSLLERWQAVRSAEIVAISQVLLDYTRRSWRQRLQRAVVIPNFAPILRLQEKYRSIPRQGRLEDARIMFVGRVCRWKGADIFAESVAGIVRDYPRIRIDIYGRIDSIEGISADKWIRSNFPEAGNRMIFHGAQPHATILANLSESDIAVFPSRFEGFGIAALEAMAVGVPTIVTAGTGYDSFAMDGVNSLSFAPGDVGAMQRILRRVIDDDQYRSALSESARQSVKSFDTDAVVSRFEEKFVEVARRSAL